MLPIGHTYRWRWFRASCTTTSHMRRCGRGFWSSNATGTLTTGSTPTHATVTSSHTQPEHDPRACSQPKRWLAFVIPIYLHHTTDTTTVICKNHTTAHTTTRKHTHTCTPPPLPPPHTDAHTNPPQCQPRGFLRGCQSRR